MKKYYTTFFTILGLCSLQAIADPCDSITTITCGTPVTFAPAVGLGDPNYPATNFCGGSSAQSGFPASYFTGPLGRNNILPSKPGAFLIHYPGGPGTTWTSIKARILQIEQAMDRKFDGIHINYWGGGTYQGIPNCLYININEKREQWVHDHGAIPVVSWSPDKSIADVNSGAVDQCFINAANYFKKYNFPIMLRLWWEFDNTAGFPWAVGRSANIGQPFITAWQRVVNIFQQQGAGNVGFWWTPLEGSPDRAGIKASYPGDAYVDWVGSDAYNGCYVGEKGCWSGYAYEGWASLAKIAAYGPRPDINQYDQWSNNKPFVFGEVGTTLDAAFPSYKAQWFSDIAPLLKDRMPKAIGISFFDQDVSALEGPRTNWLIDHPTNDTTIFAGFKQLASDPWLNTSVNAQGGLEKIYKFIPSATGTYHFEITSVANANNVEYSYKTATICNNTGWTCLNNPNAVGIFASINLNAGDSIFILVNSISTDTTSQTFQISCGTVGISDNKTQPFLYSLYPNPFNQSTRFNFHLVQSGHVNISIFNLLGARIKTISDNNFAAGWHTLTWNGTNEKNEPVSSGIYVLRLCNQNLVQSTRMVLIK